MKITKFFKAALDVVKEIHPFTLQRGFLSLPERDQKLILCLAAVLLRARLDMTDFIPDESDYNYYEDLPEC